MVTLQPCGSDCNVSPSFRPSTKISQVILWKIGCQYITIQLVDMMVDSENLKLCCYGKCCVQHCPCDRKTLVFLQDHHKEDAASSLPI